MATLIVDELRKENAALRAENARLRRQEQWVFDVAVRRVRVLEDGLRAIADSGCGGHKRRVERILAAPVQFVTGNRRHDREALW